MGRPRGEGKQHQPWSSRTCPGHIKALHTEASTAPTPWHLEENINSFYNDVDKILGKSNH